MVDKSKLQEIGLKPELIDIIVKLEAQSDEVLNQLSKIEFNCEMLNGINEFQNDYEFFCTCMNQVNYIIVNFVGENEEHFAGKTIFIEMEALFILNYFKDFILSTISEKVRKKRETEFSTKIRRYNSNKLIE